MSLGDIVLARFVEASAGTPKLRPGLILALLPGPYQTLLLCGISTRIQNVLANWDEPLQPGDVDFAGSGLHRPSVIRLSYLQAFKQADTAGAIGHIDPARLDRLRTRLADQVRP